MLQLGNKEDALWDVDACDCSPLPSDTVLDGRANDDNNIVRLMLSIGFSFVIRASLWGGGGTGESRNKHMQ